MVIASNYQRFPDARAGFGPGDDETFGALYRILTEDDLDQLWEDIWTANTSAVQSW